MSESLPEARNHTCPTCNGLGAVPSRVVAELVQREHHRVQLLHVAQIAERAMRDIKRGKTLDGIRKRVDVAHEALWDAWSTNV